MQPVSTKIVDQNLFPVNQNQRPPVIHSQYLPLNFSPRNAGVLSSLARLLSLSYKSARCGTLFLCGMNEIQDLIDQNLGFHQILTQLLQNAERNADGNHFEIYFASNSSVHLPVAGVQNFVNNNNATPTLDQMPYWITFNESRRGEVLEVLQRIKESVDAPDRQQGRERDNNLILSFIDIIRGQLSQRDVEYIKSEWYRHNQNRQNPSWMIATLILEGILAVRLPGATQPPTLIRDFQSFWQLKMQIHNYINPRNPRDPVRLRHNDCFHKVVCMISVYLSDLDNFLKITEKSNRNFHLSQNRRPSRVHRQLLANEDNNYTELVKIFRRIQWQQQPHSHRVINGGYFGQNNGIQFGNNLINGILWTKRNTVLDPNGLQEVVSSRFHCECRMFEHILALNRGIFDHRSWQVFITNVREMKITISKPCCFYCYIFLTTNALIFNDDYRGNYLQLGQQGMTPDQLRTARINITEAEYQMNSDCRLINERLGFSGKLYYQNNPHGDWVCSSSLTIPNNNNQIQDDNIIVFNQVFEFLSSLFGLMRDNPVQINQTTESFDQYSG